MCSEMCIKHRREVEKRKRNVSASESLTYFNQEAKATLSSNRSLFFLIRKKLTVLIPALRFAIKSVFLFVPHTLVHKHSLNVRKRVIKHCRDFERVRATFFIDTI